MVAVGFSLIGTDVGADAGTADAYGYRWVDSDLNGTNVTYNWTDVESTGTDAGFSYSNNDYEGPFDIGFTFGFYGITYDSFYISSNGLMTFGSGTTDSGNDPIPSQYYPDNFIAPYWDNLMVNYYPYNSGSVHYETIGDSPNRQLVVQWTNVSLAYSYTPLTFEAILNETGEIWFQYQNISAHAGLGATIGIENMDGSIGCQYSYNEAKVSDAMAVMFYRGPVGFGPDSTGVGDPGDTVTYALTVSNGQATNDSFDIEVNYTLLGWNVSICDQYGIPLTDSNGNSAPDTGELEPNATFRVNVYVEIPGAPAARTEITVLLASSGADPSVNDTVTITTETTQAQFAPPHSDEGWDSDSDGDFDYLRVNATLNVLGEGYVYLYCYLYTPTGENIDYVYLAELLPVGAQTVTADFSGEDVFSSLENGTFDVYLYLYDSEWNYLGYDVHTTAAYNYDDFETPEALFMPPHSDYAIDDDSDMAYDYLIVEVVLHVYDAGEYTIEAYMEDDYGYSVSDATHVETFSAGAHTVELMFPGWDVSSAYMDGPYYVDLYLYNPYGAYINHDLHETAAYIRSDFEGLPVQFEPPYDDYGSDTDSDGYYNYVIVEVPINCSDSGYYDVEIFVEDYWGYSFDHLYETLYLEAVSTTVFTVALDYYSIRSNGVNGWFMLDMYLFNTSNAYEYDSDSHQTAYYSLSDFDPIGAFFEPPYEDYGRDDDSDGLFDCLVTTIQVNASSTGYYDIVVYAYDPYWWTYYLFEEQLYIEENSVVEVVIEIESYYIWSVGNDGSWHLNLYIYDHWTSTQYDLDTYTTEYYALSDFDSIPVRFYPPHEDYGLDTDSDSAFDYLVVEARYECYEPGEFTFFAYLYDPWGYMIASAQETKDAHVGGSMVQFRFDGWIIYYRGVSGWFNVHLEVQSDSGTTLDTDVHYLDTYYYWYDFESPPAEFSWPHYDQAYDNDDDGLYEYLVVAATVEVYVDGDYIVSGYLYDGWGYLTDGAKNVTHLTEGTNLVEIWFDGWPITLMNANPSYAMLWITDVEGNEMDSTVHYLTETYWQSDFDPTVPSLESGWAYHPPDIDGIISAEEWFGAGAVDFVAADDLNELDGRMLVVNNDTHLFVCIDVTGDTTDGDGDTATLAFDTGNDEALTYMYEDQFVIATVGTWADTWHLVFDGWGWIVDCAPFDEDLAHHDSLAAAAGFGASVASATAHRIFEICIPLDLLDAAPGDVLGLATVSEMDVGIRDGDDESFSVWPARFVSEQQLSAYGDLVLSYERPFTDCSLDGTEGDNGWFMSDVDVAFSATGGTGGINSTYFRLGSGAWEEYESPFTVSGEGVHAVQYYSVDMTGVEEPVRTVDVMIDMTAPDTSANVTGTMGNDGWYVGTVTVYFVAEDAASGMRAIMCRLNDGSWTNVSEGALVVSTDGVHSLEFYTIDIAGHEEDVKTMEFKVDGHAPVTTALVDGSTVTLNVTDDGSGVAVTMYRVDGGDWIVYEGPFKVKGSGNHTIEYYSRDVAGNNETVNSVVVQGTSGLSILGMDWWVLLLIVALIVVILVVILFVVRRGGRAQRSPQMPSQARLYDGPPPQYGQPPEQEGHQGERPPGGYPPPPD